MKLKYAKFILKEKKTNTYIHDETHKDTTRHKDTQRDTKNTTTHNETQIYTTQRKRDTIRQRNAKRD